MRMMLDSLVCCAMLGCLLVAGCASSDPRQDLLDQRARWEVRILDWAQAPDGDLNVSTRVSGPPNSRLSQLSVRFMLLDAGGQAVGEFWHTYDLGLVPRGGPSDLLVRIPAIEQRVDGLSVSLVYEPSEAEAAHMPELEP